MGLNKRPKKARNRAKAFRILSHIIVYLISFSLIFSPAIPALAQQANNIVIDPSHAGQTNGPHFDVAPNGMDILNIAKPTDGGVSHNKFLDYNVGPDGLIINNANQTGWQNGQVSSLAGALMYNPNLGTGPSAKVILNEVTGTDISRLQGFTEIFGDKAAFILANPNGIACQGCGFLNTSRLTLVTGTPRFTGDGSIGSFDLSPTATIKIAGRDTPYILNLGLQAENTKAELVSRSVEIAGKIFASDALEIHTGNKSFDYKTGTVSSDETQGTGLAVDTRDLGGMYAGRIKIIATEKGFGIKTGGEMVADVSGMEITADGDIVYKEAAAKTDIKITSKTGDIRQEKSTYAGGNAILSAEQGDISLFGDYLYGKNVVLSAKGAIENTTELASVEGSMFKAADFKNYGQVSSGGDILFDLDRDFINYRDSAVLAGGSISIAAGRNVVNYLSEIFALGDIMISGKEGGLQNFTDAEKDIDLAVKYDNPYIENTRTITGSGEEFIQPVTPPDQETETDEPIGIYLTGLDQTIYLPTDAFTEGAAAGTSYQLGDYTVILGEAIVSYDEDNNEIITYQGTDKLTIKDSGGIILAYNVIDNDLDDPALPPEEPNPQNPENDLLEPNVVTQVFALASNALNALINQGGRIESANGSVAIVARKLMNVGIEYNTGREGYKTQIVRLLDEPVLYAGWQDMYYTRITDVYYDVYDSKILAAKDIALNAHTILNQSSTIAAGENMAINTHTLRNRTASYESDMLPMLRQMKTKKRPKPWKSHKIYVYSKLVDKRDTVYTKTKSLMLAGNTLQINAEGSVINDQIENTHNLYGGFGNPGSGDKVGNIGMNLNLPTGPNGLFRVGNNPKYLVETNVRFLDPNLFVGSDYFFKRIGYDPTDETTQHKVIGDAAYETRLVMDALMKGTAQKYLDTSITSDADQMKALYHNAQLESAALNLIVGVALTADQVAGLTHDIVWYVEKDVMGQKVLVPEVYLSKATLAGLGMDGSAEGSKIAGNNIAITAGSVVNAGTIAANDALAIKTDTLINESNGGYVYDVGDPEKQGDEKYAGYQAKLSGGQYLSIDAENVWNTGGMIAGGVTDIKAKNVVNETKIYQDEWQIGKDYELKQQAGFSGTIYGADGLRADAAEAFESKGGILASGGDVVVKAASVVFDALKLHNRSERTVKKSGLLTKEQTTTVTDTVTHQGSIVQAGGDFNLKTTGDATFKGATVDVGGSAQMIVGGNLNVEATKDTAYSYSKTTKTGMGGLTSSLDIVEDEKELVNGSVVNVSNGLTIVSGKNTTVKGSSIYVGGDADVYTGYVLDENGQLQKSATGGNFNLINEMEQYRHYEKHEKTDFTDVAVGLAGMMLNPTLAAGALLGSDTASVDYNRGELRFGVSGEQSSSESETIDNKVIGSLVKTGGNLNVTANGDINIAGSDLDIGKSGSLFAERDIKITDAIATSKGKSTYDETKVTLYASVGNAYVDVGYAVDDLVKAGEAVKDSLDTLKDIAKKYANGEATETALAEARLNVEAAKATFVTTELALAASVAGAAAAGSTTLGTGMYAGGGVNYDTTSTQTVSDAANSVASTIRAKENLSFTAKNDMEQKGALVVAKEGNVTYDIGRNLVLEAGKSTTSSSTKTTSASVSVSGTTKGSGGGTASVNLSDSKSAESSITYENAGTYAENGAITYKVGGDMTATGYTAKAKHIVADVKGNMTLESVQNSSESKNSSKNAGGGVNVGGGASPNVNAGGGKGSSSRQWTDQVTELIGTESVDVKVGETLTLAGATIANAYTDENGKLVDGGNLRVEAKHIVGIDLKDFEKSDQKGFSLAVSTGDVKDTNAGLDKGTTTIGLTHSGHEKEGITKATIGKGEIVIGDGTDVASLNLNRDIDNRQEITKDVVTGALDVDLKIDNRIFSDDGRTEIAKQNEDLLDNAEKALKNASVVPVTVAGVAHGLAGCALNPGGCEIRATDNAVHFLNNPLGPGGAIALGKAINYFEGSHPDDIKPLYGSKDNLSLGLHEEGHPEQWLRMGAPMFIYQWVKGGGPVPSNPLEQEANQHSRDEMKRLGIDNSKKVINSPKKK